MGVERGVPESEIRKAYRALALKYHPDRNPGDEEASIAFKRVQEAYDVLSDSAKRAQYDNPSMSRHADFFSNVWESFFGGEPRSGLPGGHIQISLQIGLKDVLRGVKKDIAVPQREHCSACNGQGYSDYSDCSACAGTGKIGKATHGPFKIFVSCAECRGIGKKYYKPCVSCGGSRLVPGKDKHISIDVPPGVESNMQLRIPGIGEPGLNGGRPGDVLINIQVQGHDLFARVGKDLILEYPATYPQLVLGDMIEVPLLDESFVPIVIPPGTASGTRFKVEGRGLPLLRTPNAIGDLIVCVQIDVPQADEEHKRLLEELAKLDCAGSKTRSFREKIDLLKGERHE